MVLPSADRLKFRPRAHWVNRYLGLGNYRPSRLFKYALEDFLACTLGRLATAFPGLLPVRLSRALDKNVRSYQIRNLRVEHNSYRYRVPGDLAGSDLLRPRRAILIGSCMAQRWIGYFAEADHGCPSDFIISNNAEELPPQPPQPVSDYDFQIIQIPIRSIVPDGALTRVAFDDLAGHQALFEEASQRLAILLESTMRWNVQHGLLTFVCNFLEPQQNAMGRLLPRYDLRNPTFFIHQLNVELARLISSYENAYFIDVDAIAATFGKKLIQDDNVFQTNHGSILLDYFYSHDQHRLEPMLLVRDHYQSAHDDFIRAIWAEVIAAFRTVRQTETVKLVVVDLDDTLWRGVVVDEDDIGPHTSEGWPQGIAEALAFLKKRGVLLGIISKNDRALIASLWDRIMQGRLRLEDFASVQINWNPKDENLRTMMAELSLLPRNVVFIDDNPVERARIAAAFPEVRILGSHPYYIRRILLWAAETQSASISAESAHRTEMMAGQSLRNEAMRRMTRDEFIASLNVAVDIAYVQSVTDAHFKRAFELLNKTNQFNTTGKRWSHEECKAAFARGAEFQVFKVRDKFTDYGLVGVMILDGSRIEQFVMSCRVLGLDVDKLAIERAVERMTAAGAKRVDASFVETESNFACRGIFERAGFHPSGNDWCKAVAQSSVRAA